MDLTIPKIWATNINFENTYFENLLSNTDHENEGSDEEKSPEVLNVDKKLQNGPQYLF